MRFNGSKIGNLLKQGRQKKGLTQEFVSKKLNLQSPQYVSNIERGKCPASLDTLGVLIKMYDLKAENVVQLLTSEYRNQIARALAKSRS